MKPSVLSALKLPDAAIDAAADQKIVAVVEQRCGAGRLQRSAQRGRMVGGAIDRPVRGCVAGVAASRRTGDRIVVLVENGELVAERRRHRVRPRKPVILKAQMIDELRACAVAAALQIRRVAVEWSAKNPGCRNCLAVTRVGQRVFAVQRDEAHLVVGGLRRREDRSVVKIEQLHGRRSSHPQRGGRARRQSDETRPRRSAGRNRRKAVR